MSFIDNELFCSVGFLIFLSLHSLHSFLLGRLSVFLHIRGDFQLLIRLHSQLSYLALRICLSWSSSFLLPIVIEERTHPADQVGQ